MLKFGVDAHESVLIEILFFKVRQEEEINYREVRVMTIHSKKSANGYLQFQSS